MKGFTLFESLDIKKVHFVGIGGSSMSGLAEILLSQHYDISGSDIKASNSTIKLENLGAKISVPHNEKNVIGADLLIYTVAVKETNPELIKAKELGIPIMDRAALLGQIMKKYPKSVAISGTHGKTTTTSMVTMIMLEARLNPTVHIGGELESIGGNTKIGGNNYFITEACEYYESFLKFFPYMAVILNIELDHVDYFKNIEHIKDTFYKFASLVPRDGYVVACVDDINTKELIKKLDCNIITYGIESEIADWKATDIVYDNLGCASFTLLKDNEKLAEIRLSVPGSHNVSNSLAAISACYQLGCSIDSIKKGLLDFGGTHRRFETKGIENDIRVIDDYAHHPTEVKATLKAAKNCGHSKIWCVFQPHTYTRTKSLLNDFANSFKDADTVIISDIYSAREVDTGEIHASKLADIIKLKGENAIYINGFDSIVEHLEKNASPGDLIITMGAGDIYKVGEMFLKNKKVSSME